MLNELELTGRATTHIVQCDELGAALHRGVVAPYLALRDAAAADGIVLHIVSAFRDFGAQLRIWNMKYRGDRPIYDESGRVRDHASLDEGQLVAAILRWSALPGASRHHWGTDIDVIDRAAMPENYRYQLLPEEYEPAGIFGKLNLWLTENMGRYDFFRPYADFRGGVHPEPWHLSYAPISTTALRLCTRDLISKTLQDSDILGKDYLLPRLAEIYRCYVENISSPYSGGGNGTMLV
jgi:LAS superfamily LD-carboxypeptidase LdcB